MDGKSRTTSTWWLPALAPGRDANVGAAVHGGAIRQAARLPLQGRRRVACAWSAPDTRKKLLEGLAEQGFGKDQLAEMQKIIDAEKSDSGRTQPMWPMPWSR
ncbi:MAG: hypothetical protein R3F37_23390 [Candidatus Competibacteraceae bacterium]